MFPKDEVDIRISRRDDDNRLMASPIIELVFEKNTLDLHIKIGGENVKDASTFCTPKGSSKTTG